MCENDFVLLVGQLSRTYLACRHLLHLLKNHIEIPSTLTHTTDFQIDMNYTQSKL